MSPERGGSLIAAHRGATATAIENTLPAIEHAIELGCELVELDVRRARDGALVLFHDATIDGSPVAQLTRAELAQRTGYLPPLLREALALASGRIALDIELKEDGTAGPVLEQLASFRAPTRKQAALETSSTATATELKTPSSPSGNGASELWAAGLILTSFLPSVIADVKRIAPARMTGLIFAAAAGTAATDPVTLARRCGASALVLQFAMLEDAALLADAATARLRVLVWDANADAELAALHAAPRVAAIITDRPERALELRAS